MDESEKDLEKFLPKWYLGIKENLMKKTPTEDEGAHL